MIIAAASMVVGSSGLCVLGVLLKFKVVLLLGRFIFAALLLFANGPDARKPNLWISDFHGGRELLVVLEKRESASSNVRNYHEDRMHELCQPRPCYSCDRQSPGAF
jgi:hypothetical protein